MYLENSLLMYSIVPTLAASSFGILFFILVLALRQNGSTVLQKGNLGLTHS